MKYILFILTLLPSITFSQISDGVYKNAKITVFLGNIVGIDSTQEVDPTVDIDIKGITNADINRWNDATNLVNTGYPNYTLLDYLINHVWIPQTTDALAEGTTNLYYSLSKFNAALSSKTTDNLSEGLSHKYYSDNLARNAFTVNSSSPLLYNNTTGVFGMQQASGLQSGFLSTADWNNFNNKQPALGFTPVPSTRTFTINGVTQDLTANRTFNVGTVTNITSSDNTTLTITNGTSTPSITLVSAPKLQTARTINGQSFDGTSNITIPGSSFTNIPNSSLTNSSITINGNPVSLGGSTTVTASPSVSSPSSGNMITMGTPFQPRAGGPCWISVNASLTGALGLNETITVAMSPTSGGTYTTVTTDVLLIGILGLTLDRTVSSIPVPSGWFVRVTRSGVASSATYTKWDL